MGAPVGVNMTAGDRSVTRAFSFTFENPYLERIHLGGAGAGGNATGGPQPGEPPLLNATRVGDGGAGGGSGSSPMASSLVELRVPEWFGTITAVRVDGVPARQSLDCRGPHSCTVDVPSGPANVTVTNAWGAEATAEVGEPRTMAVAAPEETADNSAHYVAFVLVAALVAYVAYAALRRAAAAATGQEGTAGTGRQLPPTPPPHQSAACAAAAATTTGPCPSCQLFSPLRRGRPAIAPTECYKNEFDIIHACRKPGLSAPTRGR